MPAHMTLTKPAKGAATRARRAKKRASDRVLAVNAEKVRQRDGYRCRVCGSTHELHVHHIRYRSQGGDHSPSNLVTLCRVCHEKVHAKTLRLLGNAEYGLGSVEGSVDVLDAFDEMLARSARWSLRRAGA